MAGFGDSGGLFERRDANQDATTWIGREGLALTREELAVKNQRKMAYKLLTVCSLRSFVARGHSNSAVKAADFLRHFEYFEVELCIWHP